MSGSSADALARLQAGNAGMTAAALAAPEPHMAAGVAKDVQVLPAVNSFDEGTVRLL